MERNLAMFHIRQVLISIRGSVLGEAIETIIAEMEKAAPSASDNKQSDAITPCSIADGCPDLKMGTCELTKCSDYKAA